MGGKSRKSGGVSRQLINALKGGNFPTTNVETTSSKKKCGSKGRGNASKKQDEGGFGLLPQED